MFLLKTFSPGVIKSIRYQNKVLLCIQETKPV